MSVMHCCYALRIKSFPGRSRSCLRHTADLLKLGIRSLRLVVYFMVRKVAPVRHVRRTFVGLNRMKVYFRRSLVLLALSAAFASTCVVVRGNTGSTPIENTLVRTTAEPTAGGNAYGTEPICRVKVNATDSESGKPLDPRVALDGSQRRLLSVQTGGGVILPCGVQRIVISVPGYQEEAVSIDLDPSINRRLSVNLERLKTIASVSSTNDPNRVSNRDALSHVSSNLLDQLSQIAGLSTDSGPSSLDIGILGHDASQTGITIDGRVVTGPAQATVAHAIDAGLFTSASVNMSSGPGALAGEVNFHTLDPSRTQSASVGYALSSTGTALNTLSFTGGGGRLTTALQLGIRNEYSPLYNATYSDQSGITFSHDQQRDESGMSAALAYQTSPKTSVKVDALITSSTGTDPCAKWTAISQCGFGPGEASSDQASTYTLTGTTGLGKAAVTAYYSIFTGRNADDYQAAILDGSPYPFNNTYQFGGHATSIEASRGNDQQSFALSAEQDTLHVTYLPQGQGPFTSPSSYDELNWNITAKYERTLSKIASLDASAGIADTLGLHFTPLANAKITFAPSAFDKVWIGGNVGSAQALNSGAATFSDPNLVYFNCDGMTRVNGPSDPITGQSDAAVKVGTQYKRGALQISAEGKHEVQSGQGIYALVPILHESAGYVPLQYLQQLQTSWSRPYACGTRLFDPSSIYVYQNITGSRRTYDSGVVSFKYYVTPHLMFAGRYALAAATYDGGDPRLDSQYSLYAPGEQLFAKTPHSLGYTIDDVLPQLGIEFVGSYDWIGKNNSRSPGSYSTINIGVVKHVNHASATFFITNVLNADSGLYASNSFGYLAPRVQAAPIFVAGTPLAPRTATFRIELR